MQTSASIGPDALRELLDLLFADGNPSVWEGDSAPGQTAAEFHSTAEGLAGVATRSASAEVPPVPSTTPVPGPGVPRADRAGAHQDRGPSFRFDAGDGDDLPQLDLDAWPESCGCRVTANSAKRAAAWSHVTDRLGCPDEWDWKAVDRFAGRLVRRLRKLGKAAAGA